MAQPGYHMSTSENLIILASATGSISALLACLRDARMAIQEVANTLPKSSH